MLIEEIIKNAAIKYRDKIYTGKNHSEIIKIIPRDLKS